MDQQPAVTVVTLGIEDLRCLMEEAAARGAARALAAWTPPANWRPPPASVTDESAVEPAPALAEATEEAEAEVTPPRAAKRTSERTEVSAEILTALRQHPEGLGAVPLSRVINRPAWMVGEVAREMVASGCLVRTGGLRGPSVRYHAPPPVVPPAPRPAKDAAPAPIEPASALAAAEAALGNGDWREADRVARIALDSVGAGHIGRTLGAAASEKRSQLLIEALRLQVQGTPQEEAAKVDGTEAGAAAEAPLVLLVGGIGRMETRYRAAVEARGLRLVYVEASQAKMSKLSVGMRPDAVLVFTTVVSHPLREAAAALAEQQQIPIHYIQEPSQSSLRRALDGLGLKSVATAAA